MTIIVPAIITTQQEELDTMLASIKNHVQRVQLDVMDGNFVPNNSLDFDFELKEDLFYEAHLMVQHPLKWIEQHGSTVDLIIFHYECAENSEEIIATIKKKGKKTGIALNPSTSIEKITPYLDELDLVLVMTVEPGFYGSTFLPEALNKVKELRKLNTPVTIEVDGGIVPETAALARKAGASIFVSGSFIMKSADHEDAIHQLNEAVQ